MVGLIRKEICLLMGCSKTYPVAMIPYANMLPYRILGTPPHCCWHDYVPRDSVAALLAGKVMAAAVPVGALPGLAGWVEPLGRYGIAARESSMSGCISLLIRRRACAYFTFY
jgi:predicted solute-binding protein